MVKHRKMSSVRIFFCAIVCLLLNHAFQINKFRYTHRSSKSKWALIRQMLAMWISNVNKTHFLQRNRWELSASFCLVSMKSWLDLSIITLFEEHAKNIYALCGAVQHYYNITRSHKGIFSKEDSIKSGKEKKKVHNNNLIRKVEVPKRERRSANPTVSKFNANLLER